MLARLQQVLTITWALAVLGWLIGFGLAGRPTVAIVGALVIASLHALALGFEFLILPWVNRDDPAPKPSAGELVRAWWDEVQTGVKVFCWRQPFRWDLEADHLPAELRGRRGVLFVHGFVCNRGLWTPWLTRLRAAGVPFVAVNLEPVFGSIAAYPAVVERGLQALEAATGVPPVVVAHSMGGLAVRAWLDAHEGDTRVHSVVTIGSPHHGTWLARFGTLPNTRQMRQDSPWLSALAQREPAARRARFTCFYSHCDNIVMPASSAALPGADNRHLRGMSHVHLADHPAVFDEVLARVAPQAASGGYSRSPASTAPAAIGSARRTRS